VHIKLGGAHIKDSPFSLMMEPCEGAVEQSCLFSVPSSGIVNEKATVELLIRDQFHNLAKSDGHSIALSMEAIASQTDHSTVKVILLFNYSLFQL
jgi:hypothetical protein